MIPVANLIAMEYPIFSFEVFLYNEKERQMRPVIYAVTNVETDYMFFNSCREITEFESQVIVKHLKEILENVY